MALEGYLSLCVAVCVCLCLGDLVCECVRAFNFGKIQQGKWKITQNKGGHAMGCCVCV